MTYHPTSADERKTIELSMANEEQRLIEKLADRAGRILALLTASTSVIYGIGFIVINSWLLNVGVLDLSPLRTAYLSAGLAYTGLFSVLMTLSFGLSTVVLFPAIDRMATVGLRSRRNAFILAVPLLFFLLTLAIYPGVAYLVARAALYFEGTSIPLFMWSLVHMTIVLVGLVVYRMVRALPEPLDRFPMECYSRRWLQQRSSRISAPC